MVRELTATRPRFSSACCIERGQIACCDKRSRDSLSRDHMPPFIFLCGCLACANRCDGRGTSRRNIPEEAAMAVKFSRIDLEYILRQILQAEADQGPINPHLAFGLREVAGTNNSSVPGQAFFGS